MQIKKTLAHISMLGAILLLGACTTVGSPSISASSQAELVDKARTSLDALYASTPEARELKEKSLAILVFPDTFKVGLIVGGSGGNGVLFSPQGRVIGYYNGTALTYGLQVGAQTYSETLFLTTPEALAALGGSGGWSIGTGPSFVVVDAGVAKDLSTTTMRSDVFAFIHGQEGLMAGIGLQGQKITKLQS